MQWCRHKLWYNLHQDPVRIWTQAAFFFVDVRERNAYNESHVMLARHTKKVWHTFNVCITGSLFNLSLSSGWSDHFNLLIVLFYFQDDQGSYKIPFDVHLPTTLHCAVYDSNTVSTVEDTQAVDFASMLASSGSKNPVMILKGRLCYFQFS